MDSRFAAFWARVLVVMGMLFVTLGIIFAGAALVLDMPWGHITGQAVLERMLAMVALMVSGVVAGAPLITIGEMMEVFLDQRRLLREISRQLVERGKIEQSR